MASPYINRFLSADTVVPNPANPQAFNRYSYVLGNPVRYVDPSGHASVCGFSYSDPDCPPVTSPVTKITTTANNLKAGSSGNGGKLTPTPIPDARTPSATPCSVVFIVCSFPTSTSTPFPTATEMPYEGPVYVAGPASTPTPTNTSEPKPFLDIEIKVDWEKVDKFDVGVDVIGLTADAVSFYEPAAPFAQAVGTTAEVIGFVKSTVELIQGDPKSMLVSQTTDAGQAGSYVF